MSIIVAVIVLTGTVHDLTISGVAPPVGRVPVRALRAAAGHGAECLRDRVIGPSLAP